ncbi:MAG: FecR domain-containing protein [Pseudomonadota bacterium]
MTTAIRDMQREALFWSVRLDEGDLTSEEQASLEDWLRASDFHAAALAEAEIIWSRMAEIDYEPALELAAVGQAEAAYERQPEPIGFWERATETLEGAWLKLFGAGAAIAAVLAVFLAAGVPIDRLVTPNEAVEPIAFETQLRQMQRIKLPDGTQITLDANSRLTFVSDEASRQAVLTRGNALLDVASDKERPFLLVAGPADIRVVGTRFDVRLSEGKAFVGVSEGEVAVQYRGADDAALNDNQSLLLKSGEATSVTAASGLGVKEAFYAGEFGAWRSGRIVYVDATLREIIDDANRYADEPIEVAPTVRELGVSGTFNVKNPEELFDALEQGLPVRGIQREGKLIIVPAS